MAKMLNKGSAQPLFMIQAEECNSRRRDIIHDGVSAFMFASVDACFMTTWEFLCLSVIQRQFVAHQLGIDTVTDQDLRNVRALAFLLSEPDVIRVLMRCIYAAFFVQKRRKHPKRHILPRTKPGCYIRKQG